MAQAGVPFAQLREQILSDPEVRKAYDLQAPYYRVIEQIITARKDKGYTQQQVAEMIGTKKGNISRLESGKGNPTLETLIKISRALEIPITIEAAT